MAFNKHILIIGAGSWGTALAHALEQREYEITLWDYNDKKLLEIQNSLQNKNYHPGIVLSKNIRISTDLDQSLKPAEVVILAIPTSTIPFYLQKIVRQRDSLPFIINASKGLNHDTLQTLSMYVKQHLGPFTFDHYAVLSGPSFASEVIQGKPCALSLGCANTQHLLSLTKLLHSEKFQIFPSTDILGVEIGGALKNVIAIAVGASDGLGLGLNTRAALITKGQEEISRIGKALGADRSTFWGLSGIGDLILTCTGDLSRNRQVGLMLAQKKSVRTILKQLGQIAEGIRTSKSAHLLAQKLKLKVPILEETYAAIYKGKSIEDAVKSILSKI